MPNHPVESFFSEVWNDWFWCEACKAEVEESEFCKDAYWDVTVKCAECGIVTLVQEGPTPDWEPSWA